MFRRFESFSHRTTFLAISIDNVAPHINTGMGHLIGFRMEYIKFDVMLNERFVCTLRMPITIEMVVDYVGDKPVISGGVFSGFIEKKRPSLIGKPYKICF